MYFSVFSHSFSIQFILKIHLLREETFVRIHYKNYYTTSTINLKFKLGRKPILFYSTYLKNIFNFLF